MTRETECERMSRLGREAQARYEAHLAAIEAHRAAGTNIVGTPIDFGALTFAPGWEAVR